MPAKSEPDRALGGAIRQLRGSMTQEELAAKAGIDVTGLRRIELGTADPMWGTVRRIARALGVAPLEVVRLAEEIRG
jgi:transcriptional regulator with XRE-family HTH domain